MKNGFTSHHWSDEDGNPGGGCSYGTGFTISWQNGPLGRGSKRNAPNGAFVEDVIDACADRIEYYQSGKFNCDCNQEALEHLNKALEALRRRTEEREHRGVEGTHQE